jgi:hypothetical protein
MGGGLLNPYLGRVCCHCESWTEGPSGLDIKLRLKRWVAGWRASRSDGQRTGSLVGRLVGVYVWLQAQRTEEKEGRTSYLGVESADNL